MNLTEKTFGKDLRSITVNPSERTVTAVIVDEVLLKDAERPLASLFLDVERMKKDAKKVSIIKCSEQDEFDQYVGAALAIVYGIFGSRTKFRKFVDEAATVVGSKKS